MSPELVERYMKEWQQRFPRSYAMFKKALKEADYEAAAQMREQYFNRIQKDHLESNH